MSDAEQWRRCSACKKPVAYGADYWVCNVSTCNQKRTGLVFCTVRCWEIHLPSVNHRESWAVERKAPTSVAAVEASAERQPRRRMPPPTRGTSASASAGEILIVASRLKDYVRQQADFHTSDGALGPLSDIVRDAIDTAIGNARREGRRTVLDRDIPGAS